MILNEVSIQKRQIYSILDKKWYEIILLSGIHKCQRGGGGNEIGNLG